MMLCTVLYAEDPAFNRFFLYRWLAMHAHEPNIGILHKIEKKKKIIVNCRLHDMKFYFHF